MARVARRVVSRTHPCAWLFLVLLICIGLFGVVSSSAICSFGSFVYFWMVISLQIRSGAGSVSSRERTHAAARPSACGGQRSRRRVPCKAVGQALCLMAAWEVAVHGGERAHDRRDGWSVARWRGAARSRARGASARGGARVRHHRLGEPRTFSFLLFARGCRRLLIRQRRRFVLITAAVCFDEQRQRFVRGDRYGGYLRNGVFVPGMRVIAGGGDERPEPCARARARARASVCACISWAALRRVHGSEVWVAPSLEIPL